MQFPKTLAEAIADGEIIDAKIAKVLAWIKNDPLAIDAVKAIPVLAPFAGKLIGLIPGAAEVMDGLQLAGMIVAMHDAGLINPMDANDLAKMHADLEDQ